MHDRRIFGPFRAGTLLALGGDMDMKLLLSTIACVSVFAACSGGDDTTDGGTDSGGGDTSNDNQTTTKVAAGPSKGSAIAVSPDDSVVVACNRDTGSISVLAMTYP